MRGTIISHCLTALLVLAGAAWADTIIMVSKIDNRNRHVTRDCHPRAWVRAEDLKPGREVRAEARLKVVGEGCEGAISKWQVGLRKKERAIFKFHAANTTLPERPVMKPEVDNDDDAQNDDFVPGDIFSSHRMRSSKRFEQYRREMEEYEAQVSAKSLWISRSAVRDVFDTVFDLPLSGTEEDTYHDDSASTYLRPFRVNIPSTNFPYTASRRSGMRMMSIPGDQDISSVEELFEYYFLLTYKDGTVVDVPAGVTAFVPASTAEQYERANSLPSVARPVHLSVPRVGDRPSAAPKETPDCDEGLVSDFKVSVELPHDGVLAAGTTHTLNVTIEQLGNSTEVPAQVSVRVRPCKRDTWAATYAFDEQHKAQATTCDDGIALPTGMMHIRFSSYQSGGSGEESVLMTKPREYDDGASPRKAGPQMRRMRDFYQDHGSVKVDAGFQRIKTMQVNLTIPEDIAFNYNQTLQSVENRLYVRIQTEFTCEKSTQPALFVGARAELLDDELWSPWSNFRSSPSPRDIARKQRTITGNTTLEILPPVSSVWNASSLLIDYKDPAAKAIVLSTIDAPSLQDDDYPHVDTLIVESEQDRQLSKFDIHQRLPVCKDYKKNYGHCQPGLAEGLSGEVWARYQWRKEQGAGTEEGEGASDSSSPAQYGPSVTQVVLHS